MRANARLNSLRVAFQSSQESGLTVLSSPLREMLFNFGRRDRIVINGLVSGTDSTESLKPDNPSKLFPKQSIWIRRTQFAISGISSRRDKNVLARLIVSQSYTVLFKEMKLNKIFPGYMMEGAIDGGSCEQC